MGREEEEERRIEKHEGVREREVDTGARERTEVTQNEVRDPTPSPTARLAFHAMLHEPTRFDWAAEVDEALGLSPVAHNAPQPEPANPAHNNVAIDPNCTARTSAAPANSIPVAIPVSPVPTDPIPIDPTPTTLVDAAATPIPPDNPFPSDVIVDTVRTISTNAGPYSPTAIQPIQSTPPPSQLDHAPPKPAITPSDGDVTPHARTPTTGTPSDRAPATSVSVDPDPDNVAPDPICAAFASSAVADTVPINTSPITTDSYTPPAYAPANHTCVTFANPRPTHSICTNHTIRITPVEPVHVDPVSVISTDSTLIYGIIGFAFITLSGIKLIHRAVENHLYSVSLTHVGVFVVF